MGSFLLLIETTLAPEEAWSRILDLRVHDDVIPLTRITEGRVSARELSVGSRFVARTGVGRFGFDDPMVIEVLQPPVSGGDGVARIRKAGRLLQGSVELRVAPRADGGAVITWQQEIRVRWISTVLQPVVVRAARIAYRGTLHRILRTTRTGT